MKIICIGRNYADHAKEMDASIPNQPIFFLKPDTALNKENKFYIPTFTNELHYEVELVIKISKTGKNIDEKFAHAYFETFGLGIDFTARDIQKKCKENGHPWEIAKAFDKSAFLGAVFLNKADFNLSDLSFELMRNGEQVQQGNTFDMLFSFDQIISYVSKFITLKQGDLIFTGTPSGVGQTFIGDELIGKIEGKKIFDLAVK